MAKQRKLLLFTILALVLSACSPLIGKWQAEDGSQLFYEFKSDGTLIGEVNGTVYVGSYRIVDDGIFTITENNLLGNLVTVTVVFSIDDGKLTTTMSGFTRTFVRVP